jgi:hypothetical protein
MYTKRLFSMLALISTFFVGPAANAVVPSELCVQQPPAWAGPGHTGPSPTAICRMSWIGGGTAIKVEHRNKVTPLVPNAWGTDLTWTDLVPINDIDSHYWVLEYVCLPDPPAPIKMEGWGRGYRMVLGNIWQPIKWKLAYSAYDKTIGAFDNTC